MWSENTWSFLSHNAYILSCPLHKIPARLTLSYPFTDEEMNTQKREASCQGPKSVIYQRLDANPRLLMPVIRPFALPHVASLI